MARVRGIVSIARRHAWPESSRGDDATGTRPLHSGRLSLSKMLRIVLGDGGFGGDEHGGAGGVRVGLGHEGEGLVLMRGTSTGMNQHLSFQLPLIRLYR
jgi:hypothetical protein